MCPKRKLAIVFIVSGFALLTALGFGLKGLLFNSPPAKAQQAAPPTPHSLEGRANCLLCHSAGGVKPIPADHAGRPNESCLLCHPVALAPTPTPTPSPTAEATTTPLATPTSTPSPPPGATMTPTPALAEPTPTPLPSPTPTLFPSPTPTPPPYPTPLPGNAACFICHQNPSLNMTFPSGEKLPLYIDPAVLGRSVHGDKLLCTDCHTRITLYPHPKVQATTYRQMAIVEYEACKRCHFINYTKTLDSTHFEVLAKGNVNAPVCTDCHGAHNVTPTGKARGKIAQTCSKCHPVIYTSYYYSAHGRALFEEENYDVPVCTTCHGVHNIHRASVAEFRIDSVELCGKCHGDKNLMQKYGISPVVLKTYLEDFHGKSVSFLRAQKSEVAPRQPLCIDCHGVHDIKMVDNPNSPVFRANLLSTCQKCHPGAPPNFPSAWLSHYEPSPKKAPLVYYVKLYYWILIPFMLVGLMFHILLDLWRLARGR